MRWSVFLCGAGLLCLASWIDNLKGPLLPVVSRLMDLDYVTTGFIVSLGNFVSMISTWLLMPLLNRWSLKQVGIGVVIYALIVCGATQFVSNKGELFLWGALLGGCISTLGSLSNLFVQSGVEISQRGQTMSALHSIYGLISFFTPIVAGMILSTPENWRLTFTSIVPFAFVGVVCMIWFVPDPTLLNTKSRSLQPMNLKPIHVLAIAVPIFYVLGETLTSTWMPSFLVEVYKLDIKSASTYTSLFFAMILVTRMSCVLWARPKFHRLIIWISTILSIVFFVAARCTGWMWLLPLTGILGPFFPLYVTWLGLRYPERDRSLIIWSLSGMQGALCLSNIFVGKVADKSGFSVAYWTPAVMLILTLLLLKILEIIDSGTGPAKEN